MVSDLFAQKKCHLLQKMVRKNVILGKKHEHAMQDFLTFPYMFFIRANERAVWNC
jgi:hypothetical protein